MKNFYNNEALSFENQHGFDGNDLMVAGPQGNPNMGNEGESEPFIITLTETTGVAVNNVTIFNAAASVGTFNNGVTAGIVATYGYSGVSYAQVLNWMLAKTFQVGAFQVITTTDAQALQTFTVSTVDNFGNSIGKTIVPRMDGYQQKVGNIYQKAKFAINSNTTITITQIAAGLTVTYYFFPDVVEAAGGQWKTKEIVSSIRPLAIASK